LAEKIGIIRAKKHLPYLPKKKPIGRVHGIFGHWEIGTKKLEERSFNAPFKDRDAEIVATGLPKLWRC